MIANRLRRASFFVSSVFCAIFTITAYAQSTWVTVRNTEFSFRFIHPPEWRVATPRGPNVRYSINAPPGTPLANCNIVVRRMPALAALTQRELNEELKSTYSAKDWNELMGDKAPDLRIIERRSAKVDNQPAQYSVLEYSYETVQMKIYMRSMTVVTFSPGVFWNFSCGGMGRTLAEGQQAYAHWGNVFSGIISSLVFER